MGRAKAVVPATKAKARSSGHPANTFRKDIEPVASKGSKGSDTSSSLDGETSGSEEETDEDSSGSETDTAEDATGTGSAAASAADDDSGDPDTSSSPDDDASGMEADFGDSSSSTCETEASDDSTSIKSAASSAGDCDDGCTIACLVETILLQRIAVKYLQSNKVLGAIAFAYGFRDDGVARPPKSRLHYYADMLEAFIETVFDDNASAGTEWLEALWSSRCFPDLQSCIEDHWRSYGTPYKYSDLSEAHAY
ncbi:hypothetical protein JCM8115_000143 [Rhodotorula mucilaginosa]